MLDRRNVTVWFFLDKDEFEREMVDYIKRRKRIACGYSNTGWYYIKEF